MKFTFNEGAKVSQSFNDRYRDRYSLFMAKKWDFLLQLFKEGLLSLDIY